MIMILALLPFALYAACLSDLEKLNPIRAKYVDAIINARNIEDWQSKNVRFTAYVNGSIKGEFYSFSDYEGDTKKNVTIESVQFSTDDYRDKLMISSYCFFKGNYKQEFRLTAQGAHDKDPYNIAEWNEQTFPFVKKYDFELSKLNGTCLKDGEVGAKPLCEFLCEAALVGVYDRNSNICQVTMFLNSLKLVLLKGNDRFVLRSSLKESGPTKSKASRRTLANRWSMDSPYSDLLKQVIESFSSQFPANYPAVYKVRPRQQEEFEGFSITLYDSRHPAIVVSDLLKDFDEIPAFVPLKSSVDPPTSMSVHALDNQLKKYHTALVITICLIVLVLVAMGFGMVWYRRWVYRKAYERIEQETVRLEAFE